VDPLCRQPGRHDAYRSWDLGIKNDYRTLIGLEGVNVVDNPTDIDEEEDDE
jgi:hypothetical protein